MEVAADDVGLALAAVEEATRLVGEVVLADRAERLRKELAETDAEVARLEAAEVVIGSSSMPGGAGRPTTRLWLGSWSG